jgi:flavin reductase (DIM6/NTAB) family NADH-FMN oxidoreductase RutF
MDADAINHLFRLIDRELWIVTSAHAGARGGLIATSAAQASIVPDMPRVIVAISKLHRTWELIEAGGAFALHLIRAEQLDLVARFGLQSARDVDKFAGLQTTRAATGSPILLDMPGWLDCRVEARLDSGERTFYLAAAVAGEVLHPDAPLLTTHRLAQSASPEMQAELKRQLADDAARDVPAITAWRTAHAERPR